MRKTAMDKRVPVAVLAQRLISQTKENSDIQAVKEYLKQKRGMTEERAYRYLAGYGKSRGCSLEEAARRLREELQEE